MDLRYSIPTYANRVDKTVNVVVEIPKGTNNKYEIDPKNGEVVNIVRTLHTGIFRNYKYIYNYGFIPNTLADDGDQLDAIIIADEEINPLTVIECKVIGVIKTVDNGEQDDKILVVPVYSTKHSTNLKKIMKFLKNYKYPYQDGTEIGDFLDKDEALKVIDECRMYMNTPKEDK